MYATAFSHYPPHFSCFSAGHGAPESPPGADGNMATARIQRQPSQPFAVRGKTLQEKSNFGARTQADNEGSDLSRRAKWSEESLSLWYDLRRTGFGLISPDHAATGGDGHELIRLEWSWSRALQPQRCDLRAGWMSDWDLRS